MLTLEGRRCLVTGSTSGIGREIAFGLARLGADLIIVGRTEAKCKQNVEEIRLQRGDRNGVLSYFAADLSSQDEVRRLAQYALDSCPSLEVLVNNAGVFEANRDVTMEGIERTFAVNHLAPFLLTGILADRLKAAQSARVVTTSSVAHRGATVDFDDINFERRRYSGLRAYGQSKLANILFTRELAKRLNKTGVTANCFHPGGVRTNLINNSPILYRIIWAIASPFFASPSQGASTGVYLASSPDVAGKSGKYFVKQEETTPSVAALDDKSAQRLWTLSEEMTGLQFTT